MSANDDGRPPAPGVRPPSLPGLGKPEPSGEERTRLMTPPPKPGKGDSDDGFEATRFMPRQPSEPDPDEGTVVIPAGSPLRSQLARTPPAPQAPPLRPLPPLSTPATPPASGTGDAEATQVRPRATPPRAPTKPNPSPAPAGRTRSPPTGLPGPPLAGKEEAPGTGPTVGDAPVRQVGRNLIQPRLGRGGMPPSTRRTTRRSTARWRSSS